MMKTPKIDHRTQARQRHPRGPVALAADDREPALAQFLPLQPHEGEHDQDQDHRKRRRRVVLGRMAVVQHAVDLVGENVHAARIAEEQRVLEAVEAAGEDEHGGGEDGRRHHRQRDGENGPVLARAQGDRGFLKGGIHRVEEPRQHEEHERRGAEGGVEDQAGPAVEIDHRPLDAEPGLCELVDEAVLRIAEHQPRDAGQQVRSEERHGDQQQHRPPERHVGARHGPGEQKRQRQAQDEPCRRVDHAVDEDGDEIVRGKPGAVAFQRELSQAARLS